MSRRYAARNTKYGRRPSDKQRASAKRWKSKQDPGPFRCSCGPIPATYKQQTYLRALAYRRQTTFEPPRCVCHASYQLSAMKGVRYQPT